MWAFELSKLQKNYSQNLVLKSVKALGSKVLNSKLKTQNFKILDSKIYYSRTNFGRYDEEEDDSRAGGGRFRSRFLRQDDDDDNGGGNNVTRLSPIVEVLKISKILIENFHQSKSIELYFIT